jgi:protein-disulfide isomerase
VFSQSGVTNFSNSSVDVAANPVIKIIVKGVLKYFTKSPKITVKIARQLQKRGWTQEQIDSLVNNPYTTRPATNKASGNPATAYFGPDGRYVVVDDLTDDVIQISEVGNPGWVPDSVIQDPFTPGK